MEFSLKLLLETSEKFATFQWFVRALWWQDLLENNQELHRCSQICHMGASWPLISHTQLLMGNQLLFKTKTSYSLKPVKPMVHYVGFPPCFNRSHGFVVHQTYFCKMNFARHMQVPFSSACCEKGALQCVQKLLPHVAKRTKIGK